ncbi:MAG: hypothetical protein VB118_06620, partial [Oscillospiraceae bacterium]|nr:hypothetical protein [Oscillospiraceae bacterium]
LLYLILIILTICLFIPSCSTGENVTLTNTEDDLTQTSITEDVSLSGSEEIVSPSSTAEDVTPTNTKEAVVPTSTEEETNTISESGVSSEEKEPDTQVSAALEAMAAKLVPGTYKIENHMIVDIPIMDEKDFPEYYNTKLFERFTCEMNGCRVRLIYNDITGKFLVYVTDLETGKVQAFSRRLINFMGHIEFGFINENQFLFVTRSARGFKDISIYDFEKDGYVCSTTGQRVTAYCKAESGKIYYAVESSVFDQNGIKLFDIDPCYDIDSFPVPITEIIVSSDEKDISVKTKDGVTNKYVKSNYSDNYELVSE